MICQLHVFTYDSNDGGCPWCNDEKPKAKKRKHPNIGMLPMGDGAEQAYDRAEQELFDYGGIENYDEMINCWRGV